MSNIKENETLQKINSLLRNFNETFEVKANLTKDGDEIVADRLIVESLKNDGSQFVETLHDTFNTIVQAISNDHEVIYDEEKGLAIARKVIKTDYVIEDFNN